MPNENQNTVPKEVVGQVPASKASVEPVRPAEIPENPKLNTEVPKTKLTKVEEIPASPPPTNSDVKPVKSEEPEPENRKSARLLVAIFIIIGAFVFFLPDIPEFLTTAKEEINKLFNQTESVGNTPAKQEENITEQPSGIVTTGETYEKTYNDKLYEMKMPIININSIGISEVNDEIEELYNKTKTAEDEDNLIFAEMSYSYYSDDEILSLVIKTAERNAGTEDSGYKYSVYNIDLEENEIITNSELLGMNQLVFSSSEETMYTKLKAELTELYPDKTIGEIETMIFDDMEISENSSIFIDKNGKITVVVVYAGLLADEKIEIVLN